MGMVINWHNQSELMFMFWNILSWSFIWAAKIKRGRYNFALEGKNVHHVFSEETEYLHRIKNLVLTMDYQKERVC